jgi:hypothetical protein
MLNACRSIGYRPACFAANAAWNFSAGTPAFRSLGPRHFYSRSAVDFYKILLAGPTRERKQPDAFGTAFSSRLRALLCNLRPQRFCELSFL